MLSLKGVMAGAVGALAAASLPGAVSAAPAPAEQNQKTTIAHAQSGRFVVNPGGGGGGDDGSDDGGWWPASRQASSKRAELTHDEEKSGTEWRFISQNNYPGYYQIQQDRRGCLAAEATKGVTYVVLKTCQRGDDSQLWTRERSATARNRWLILNDSAPGVMQPQRDSKYLVVRMKTDADGQQWLLPGWAGD
ncbi:hypothetical protein FHR84_003270 [Actinopolyspora biskrensis]|uniref:Ricin B lectin domain-containing protein n=1 Tax=Actinopolyspora biskrensis TaxID=1470178 RepID=A0A852YZ99_9ACTN|nr:hypothetical protein [Actinopolyspora biskrensis]NYH79921.1 hypothetical protein [Actinopolyspora biskrensis]